MLCSTGLRGPTALALLCLGEGRQRGAACTLPVTALMGLPWNTRHTHHIMYKHHIHTHHSHMGTSRIYHITYMTHTHRQTQVISNTRIVDLYTSRTMGSITQLFPLSKHTMTDYIIWYCNHSDRSMNLLQTNTTFSIQA